MSILQYKGQHYNLSKEGDRQVLAGLNEFSAGISELANSWYSDKDFSFTTSGTTGSARHIVHSKTKLRKSAEMTVGHFQLTQNDVSLLCLDATRIAGAMMVIRSIIAGMKIIAVEPTSGFENSAEIEACTFSALVPIQLAKILEGSDKIKSFQNFKSILVGGAPLNSRLLDEVSKFNLPVFETFGMTETVSHFAIRDLRNPENPFSTLGNHEIQQDSEGCMLVKGDLTDNQKLSTSEVIRLVDSKHFFWVGRSDFVINSGGIKVSPEEIERKIADSMNAFGIQNRYIISSKSDDILGERIILVLEGPKISSQISEELIRTLKQTLNEYESPKEILFIDQFPEVANSKVDRKKLTSILA